MGEAAGQPLPQRGGVLKNASLMGLATFLSRIMGLAREQVFAYFFGAGNATDAFNVAFRIPNLLRDLFAEGAMSASLVPSFTRARLEEGDRRAWRLAGQVFRILFVLVGFLALLGMFFAPELVRLYAGAFQQIPGKFDLTVRMTRIMFPFFPLVALAAAYMGVLNACGIFFLPAFASALFNIGSVASGVTLVLLLSRPEWLPEALRGLQPIEGMAFGVLIGGGVQAFCQLPALYRVGYRWTPRLPQEVPWWRDARLGGFLGMMVPGMLGLAATQVNVLVNTILATSQGSGAVSWLNYAFRLMQFPIGIFGVSMATATLSRVSQLWVSRDAQGAAGTISQSLRHVFAVNLAASAGLVFLGVPIIELIFEYGRFTHQDTWATAVAVAMYSVGLTAYSGVKVLVPACYALGNTRIPVVSSVLAVVVTIGLNFAMIGPLGYWGLALGTSLAAIVNFVFLLSSIRSLLRQGGGELELRPLVTSFLGYLAIALVMGAACYGSHQLLLGLFSEDLGPRPLVRALRVFLSIGVGLGVWVVLVRQFRLGDAAEVVDLFWLRIKKRLKS